MFDILATVTSIIYAGTSSYNANLCAMNRQHIRTEFDQNLAKVTGHAGYYFDSYTGNCFNGHIERVGLNYGFLGECGSFVGEDFTKWPYDSSIRNAKLMGSDLRYSNFQNMNMVNSKLTKAKFECVKANEAFFSLSNFEKLNISGAHFRKAYLDHIQGSNVVAIGTELNESNLSESNFSNSTFSYSNLSNSIGVESDFSDSKLDNLKMESANFARTSFKGADFFQSDLSSGTLVGCDFTAANLRNAVMRNGRFSESSFYGADLSGADLRGSDFRGANLRGVKSVAGAIIDEYTKFDSDERGRFHIEGWVLTEDNSNYDGAYTNFWKMKYIQNFNSSSKGQLIFNIATMEHFGFKFVSANPNFYGYRSEDTRAGYICADRYGNFGRNPAYIEGKSAECSDLTDSDLSDLDLSFVDFTGSILENVNFRNSNLVGMKLYSGDVFGADFENADLTGAYIDHEPGRWAKSWRGANQASATIMALDYYSSWLSGPSIYAVRVLKGQCENFSKKGQFEIDTKYRRPTKMF